MNNIFDRGSAILVEVELKKRVPFVFETSLFDPAVSQKITVLDEKGTVVINNVNLVKSTIGKYYYIIQSLAEWTLGKYIIKILVVDTVYSDVNYSNQQNEFYLQ